ncbi:chitin synthase [Blastomyces parvus]|uniref:chitin synthase n=1 Tax=Blastomyces parvus TaxID=2060905 RepID=A0A2B7XCN2_9EURO|nr:chitin synthase [Blastomyces parvus]
MANRYSVYSTTSSAALGARSTGQQAAQVSTTTLLNTLHTIYSSGQSYQLESGTALTVNTWLTAASPGPNGEVGGTVDAELARRAWEHARRRAEDGCIVLCSSHQSTPSLLAPFLAKLPLSTPSTTYTALSVLRPFISQVTPHNPSQSRYSALAVSYTFTLAGNVTAVSLALSTAGLDISSGLLDIPAEAGYRAFDVFYYLLTSASTPAEREFLSLKDASTYSLLNKSNTFNPPAYLPTADDAAAAEDFRASLRAIGIKGAAHRSLITVLAALLKLGNSLGFLVDQEELEEICEDVGGLLNLDPEVLLHKCSTDDRTILIAGIYEALVDWVIAKANETIFNEIHSTQDSNSSDGGPGQRTPWSDEETGDTVGITVVEIPDPALGKAIALRGVFDDSLGINAEMKEDGIEVAAPGHSVIKEMHNAVAEVEADMGVQGSAASREREQAYDRKGGVLEKVGVELEMGAFLRQILYPVENEGINLGKKGRFDLTNTLGSSRVWYQLALHPTDDPPATLASLPSVTSSWSAGAVSRQLRAWRLPEWANRRNKHLDFTADFDVEEFVTRYSRLGCQEGKDGVESWILERGWSNGDVVIGNERIWVRESAWWEAESMLDMKPQDMPQDPFNPVMTPFESGYSSTPPPPNASGFFPPETSFGGSRENLMHRQSVATMSRSAFGGARSIAPTVGQPSQPALGDYGLGPKGDDRKHDAQYYDQDLGTFTGQIDAEYGDPKKIEKKKIPLSRRLWAGFAWALTFWIPSFVLRYVGRMKRPDVRMAWREKVTLMALILLLNATMVFWIIGFGNLLCPNKDKVWSQKEVGFHQGDNDYYVSIHGVVYDISKFWKVPHAVTRETSKDRMEPFRGLNMDAYFPIPLTVACRGFGISDTITIRPNNTEALFHSYAVHASGPLNERDPNSKLHDINWYDKEFRPRIKEYYKGDVVWDNKELRKQAEDDQRRWVVLGGEVFDLTDYFHTLKEFNNLPAYDWLPEKVTKLFLNNPGEDISDKWESNVDFQNSYWCLRHQFYVGKTDFRKTARCQVNNYILLAFTCVLASVILIKFVAALQLGTKRRPTMQDKFVICQVPAYTEGEDQLRKGLDSLTALQYDNKRKLIFVICDGMIVGGGNDRPTPKIVLDILGVDPKIDPPALPFKSVGNGSDQLNYGKVYSGLYEFEGNVVPYIVVVKVGKESEQTKSKPGNRGKRDSQVLILSFLNRVHHRSAMSPLELEIFHQINNVIGVDPELYEYLLMVDADTSVKEDSLNRLVASCANDSKIAGICGETSLENEERSWWTMIQVYEYYISHHLAKAFESLFGSVTCLPGCFCMYRLRTADKGRPLIISDKVLSEYSDIDVDTLHKKNLLALGEDRYLTTLMTKHFPNMRYKFIPDAYASTAAPETWSVLLSQRRRWINSTIHNLAELMFLSDLCGFCCFSMRFVVFIDLFGTIILPATCAYLVYIIYLAATNSGQFPIISIAIIAGVYGLQAIIFIIKRQWQHIGWMIIYIIAFPIYSFVLPLYSFWNQDNFSWGNTRIVIGEKGDKRVIAVEDEGFDPRSIPLQRWDDYALANNLPGRRGNSPSGQEKFYQPVYADDAAMEMDDMHSTYSSVKPASTILTGFPTQGPHGPYMTPHSASPFGGNMAGNRNSHMSSFSRYTDQPLGGRSQNHLSMGNLSSYHDNPASASRLSGFGPMGTESHLGVPQRQSMRSPLGMARPTSTMVDFRTPPSLGPDEATITEAIQNCLSEVDLDTVTKKQVRALVEQRLQTTLTGDKKAFLDRQIDTELANM